MSRYLITIATTADRDRALRVVAAAPWQTRVEVKAPRRSVAQNSRMWAMLSSVAMALPWHGKMLRPDDWKFLFLDALKRERRMMPNLAGDGFVELSRSSSDLTVEEMSDLMTLIEKFAAEHGVMLPTTP